MELALKEFIEKNIRLIEQNKFKELYIKAKNEPDLEIYDLTKLLYTADIDPLKELDYIPSMFMMDTHLTADQPQSIDLSHLIHIKHIESFAFGHNHNLKEIILPPNLETIGAAAFIDSGLEKLLIPKSVKDIDDLAFRDCENLSEVIIEGNPTISLTAFTGDHVMRNYIVHSLSVAYDIPKRKNVTIEII